MYLHVGSETASPVALQSIASATLSPPPSVVSFPLPAPALIVAPPLTLVELAVSVVSPSLTTSPAVPFLIVPVPPLPFPKSVDTYPHIIITTPFSKESEKEENSPVPRPCPLPAPDTPGPHPLPTLPLIPARQNTARTSAPGTYNRTNTHSAPRLLRSLPLLEPFQTR